MKILGIFSIHISPDRKAPFTIPGTPTLQRKPWHCTKPPIRGGIFSFFFTKSQKAFMSPIENPEETCLEKHCEDLFNGNFIPEEAAISQPVFFPLSPNTSIFLPHLQ